MNFFTVFALFFFITVVASLSPRLPDDTKKVREECQADPKYSLDNTLLEKIKNHEKVEPLQIAKLVLCVNVKLGFQNENGDVNVDYLRSILESDNEDKVEINKIIAKCGVAANKTPEEAAVKFVNCMTSFRPRNGPPHH